MPTIAIEGLTGCGKTSTLAAMRAERPGAIVFDEERTFGEFFDEYRVAPERAREAGVARLARVLDDVARLAAPDADVLLERCYLSFDAIDGEWEPYDAIDARAAELRIGLVLLDLPDAELARRCMYRAEYGGADWQQLGDRYGSPGAALEALRRSQARRRDALATTRLATLAIDTSAMEWPRYAATIWRWADHMRFP